MIPKPEYIMNLINWNDFDIDAKKLI